MESKNKIKTPREIINKFHGTENIVPMYLTLTVSQISKLMKAYHEQFSALSKINEDV